MESASRMNYNERPFIAIWEVTQSCALACMHCRASAQPYRHPLELSAEEGKRLIDEIMEMRVPVFVITGGDPLNRPDIFELVKYASDRGVRVSLTPSATPLLTREAIAKLKDAGLARLAVSLDGSTPETHDNFRRVAGSYAWTLNAVRWARELGLPVQINTTITRRTLPDFESMVALLKTLDIMLWSVFFLVPTGRGQSSELVTAEEFEQVFARLYELAGEVPFDIKTTEAQHYRRYVLQRRREEKRRPAVRPYGSKDVRASWQTAETPQVRRTIGLDGPPLEGGTYAGNTPDGIGRAPRGINDAKGFVFISHLGEVYPSGFLPISAGNVRKQSLVDIYQHSPLFVSLRDTSNLKGKCGVCEFRNVCGGSRARSYAVSGDPFAEEPCCVYQPKEAAVEA